MSVFTEVRRTSCNRLCQQCGDTIRTSDPCVSIRISPWAYGDSTGEWQVIRLCEGCGTHKAGVSAR